MQPKQKSFFYYGRRRWKGFDKNDTANNGIGLANVKNRVNFLEGHFEIHSNIGDGTTINIEFNVTK